MPGVSVPLPVERTIRSREAYLETISGDDPPYLRSGVEYPSIPTAARTGFWHPLSNETSFDRYSDQQVLPTVHPFLDRRLVDLSLRMPRRYALRYNLVDRALSRLSPTLASIPHADPGVVPSRRRWAHRLGTLRSRRDSDAGGNAAELRRMEWIVEFLEEREEEIRALPLVDYDAAIETYREHVGCGPHRRALWTVDGARNADHDDAGRRRRRVGDGRRADEGGNPFVNGPRYHVA